ncbi:hypothetical protein [Glutamicibacter arilaitensis]|uniref:hypothetical protein n=1 Tax=Glutamicibacter arilaitensis TaxID=256701 RepID=UPI003FD56702
MKNWTQLIPVQIRNALYIGFGVLSLAQSAILAYSAAVQAPAPLWAVGGGAVLGVIGGAFGFVAAGNTNVSKPVSGPELNIMMTDSDVSRISQGLYERVRQVKTAYPVSDPHAPTEADPARYDDDK